MFTTHARTTVTAPVECASQSATKEMDWLREICLMDGGQYLVTVINGYSRQYSFFAEESSYLLSPSGQRYQVSALLQGEPRLSRVRSGF